MESNYQVTTQMRNKFAMHMFHVTLPMDFVDKIKRGDPNSGTVQEPDKIISLRSK